MTGQISPQELVNDLVDLLTIEQTDEDHYLGKPVKGGIGRVFGGQVVAQALQAAQKTIADDRIAHSLHAYFLRGGEEGPPIDYRIARDFDGRSFANRRVVASQNGKPLLNLTASFQIPETGLTHQASDMPDVTPPEDLSSDAESRRQLLEEVSDTVSENFRKLMLRPRPIETRTVDKRMWVVAGPTEPRAHCWFRTVAPLPEDPVLHRAVIAYASDYVLLGTSLLPHGLSWVRDKVVGASLDHTIWFHADARADDWLLYTTDSPWSGGGRGFNRGRIYDRQGKLIASVAQEGVMRTRKPQAPSH